MDEPLPCGLHSLDCPRPEVCEECLPRDRRQLHDRVLTHCDPAWYGLHDNPPKVFAALRAAVLLCMDRQAPAVDGRFCDVEEIWASELLKVIAAEFGIHEGTPA